MKKILLLICFYFLGNSIKAQDYTGMVHTDFDYVIISSNEHHFIFHTSFTLGSGPTCPPFTSAFSIVDNTLYVKGYYDIRGAWPQNGCERTDTVIYSNEIPANITHIITSTNLIKNIGSPPGYATVENVYTRDFDLGLLSNNQNVLYNNNIIMFPNPANSTVNINSNLEFNEIVVTNQLAQIVKKFKQYGSKKISIDSLQDGNYYLTLYLDNEKKGFAKFIKQSE